MGNAICDQKYLDVSKKTFGQGLESGLLYISLTKAGESLARTSPEASIFDRLQENEMLKNKASCEMLLDHIDHTFYAKLRANNATIQDVYFTIVMSETQPLGLKMLVGPLLKRYISFYCPYPSDEKTFKKFLDSNGIDPNNYSYAELEAITYCRGYEKPLSPSVAKVNGEKRKNSWKFW